MNPVEVRGESILFNGQEVQILERLSGKFMAHLARGRLEYCRRWVEHNEKLGFNSLRVFGEEMQPKPGYETPPHYKPWPLKQMLNGNRVKEDQVDRLTLEALYLISQNTGMAFSLVIDNTLKDIQGLADMTGEKTGAGMIGHVVSRTLDVSRQVAELYPGAKVIFDFHYGWDTGVVDIKEKGSIHMSAKRTRRWQTGVYGTPSFKTAFSYTSPGPEWRPEQYPEAVISVSESDGKCSYDVGTSSTSSVARTTRSAAFASVHEYPIVSVLAPAGLELFKLGPLRRHNAPIFVTGTEFATDENHDRYIRFLEWAADAGLHVCACDRKGESTDLQMPTTKLEEWLSGSEPPPPPPPPPEEWETLYRWEREGKEFRFQSRDVETE